MSDFEFHRRDLLKLIGFAVAADRLYAQRGESSIARFEVPADYRPRLLTPSEYELAAELCEFMIPSDPDSPGAIEAGVPWFIDTVLLYADAGRQQAWRSGLATIDACSSRLTGNTFLLCSASGRLKVVQYPSRREYAPGSPEERFFGELKALAVQAFCLSDLGMKKYLHYRGNAEISEFPGCPKHTPGSS